MTGSAQYTMLLRQRVVVARVASATAGAKLLSRQAATTTANSSFSLGRPLISQPSHLNSNSQSTLGKQLQNRFFSIARRSYAPEPVPAAPTPKKKRFRFLRWTYRLTILSTLGLTGYLGYRIYLLRHPAEQIEPDPSKKTLVILGAFFFFFSFSFFWHFFLSFSLSLCLS